MFESDVIDLFISINLYLNWSGESNKSFCTSSCTVAYVKMPM